MAASTSSDVPTNLHQVDGDANTKRLSFVERLPYDIRVIIYEHVVTYLTLPDARNCCQACCRLEDYHPSRSRASSPDKSPNCFCGGFGWYKSICQCPSPLTSALSLMQTSKLIRDEVLPIFLRSNCFDFRGTPDELYRALSSIPGNAARSLRNIEMTVVVCRLDDFQRVWNALFRLFAQHCPSVRLKVGLEFCVRREKKLPSIWFSPESVRKFARAMEVAWTEAGLNRMTGPSEEGAIISSGCDHTFPRRRVLDSVKPQIRLKECYRKLWAFDGKVDAAKTRLMKELERKESIIVWSTTSGRLFRNEGPNDGSFATRVAHVREGGGFHYEFPLRRQQ